MKQLEVRGKSFPRYDYLTMKKNKKSITITAVIDNTGNVFSVSDKELAQLGYVKKNE